MKAKLVVQVQLSSAWWWGWLYVPGVVFLAMLGATPDWDKVQRMAGRAVRVRLVPCNRGVLEA